MREHFWKDLETRIGRAGQRRQVPHSTTCAAPKANHESKEQAQITVKARNSCAKLTIKSSMKLAVVLALSPSIGVALRFWSGRAMDAMVGTRRKIMLHTCRIRVRLR
ncbi:uncharacterized protein [Miscanthus floridulus]|uniref:uncharacterized protein isoform X2 n=1 Tax=Miscanthus floridulus TaxID=154761 RepID=UPI0034580AAE